jgi:hypothetical protein
VNVIEKNWRRRKMRNDDDAFYDVFLRDFDLELISFF